LSFGPFSGLSPVSGHHFWSLSACGFSRGVVASLQDFAAALRVSFGVLRGRRLAFPAVFPPDERSRVRFSRRPYNVHSVFTDALPVGIFFKDASGIRYTAEAPIVMKL
jgi:hypothetical protein